MAAITMTPTGDGAGIVIAHPYHAALVKRWRQLGGSWNALTKAWTIPASVRDAAEAALKAELGWAPDAREVTVRITATKDLVADLGPVSFAGNPVCGARHRDSGALLEGGAILISGDPGSGGSRKNWETRVPEGTVFQIKVPETALELAGDDWTVARVDEAPGPTDREALRLEREKLAARMAEIDAILAGA